MPESTTVTGASTLLTAGVIGAAIEVHRCLGPGLLESVYQTCMHAEMSLRGIPFRSEVPMPLHYKGRRLDNAYRVDFIVADSIVIELKAVDQLMPIHQAQVLTYLRLLKLKLGLLINFNVPTLSKGIRRLANGL